MTLLNIAIVALGTLTPLWAESVMSDAHKQWVQSNFERVKGKKLNVVINENGEFCNPTQKTIKNVVDYIQLLASDLVASKATNKMMLLEGFVLFAILQGDVFPVDYGNIASKSNGLEPLLKNAAKIAAYGMTYRRGINKGDAANLPDRIKSANAFVPGKVFNVSDKPSSDNSPEYLYDNNSTRVLARTKLNTNDSMQAQALDGERKILFAADAKAPTDIIYTGMYTNNVKRVDSGDPKGLPLAANEKDVNEQLKNMGIVGAVPQSSSGSQCNIS